MRLPFLTRRNRQPEASLPTLLEERRYALHDFPMPEGLLVNSRPWRGYDAHALRIHGAWLGRGDDGWRGEVRIGHYAAPVHVITTMQPDGRMTSVEAFRTADFNDLPIGDEIKDDAPHTL